MGQNSSSTVRRKSGVLPPNLEVLLTEPATADYSPIRPSRKPSVERLFPTGPSISEINKAIKFVEDFLPLYTQQNVNLVPLSTSPLIAIDSRPLEYASAPAEIRIKENVLRVVETTEFHAQLGQEIARTQATNPYKRFSFANTKDAMHFSPKKSPYQSNNFSQEISPPERSTHKGMGDSLHIKGSFGNAMGLQSNLNRSNRSNRSDRSNKSQQDTSRFADVGEEQYKSQYKDKDYYQLSISPKTKKMNRPIQNNIHPDENDEPAPLKRQAFPIHGSFGGDPLMNPQKQMESVSFRANTNPNTNSNTSNASSNKEMMENSRMYKPQNDLNTSKDLRSRVDEEFNRLKGPNKSGINNSNMKRNDQMMPQNNYGSGINDYYGNNPQENLYGTQTLADNLHRQHKSPNSQKNNWNMNQSIQNDNNYYPYTPLKQENFYNTQPRDQYRNVQESGRGKLDHSRNNISPRSIKGGQDTNRSMLTPESSRANLFNQSHIAKTGPVKKQEIPVLHHKLDQQPGYGQMRKSVKTNPSPSNAGGGSISSYAQMRQNQAQGPKGKGPLNYQKQQGYDNSQQMYNQRSITPHPRPSNKDLYNNPQNLSTDYHYSNNNNNNNDMDINPISVNLNLNELLEEADRSMSYSQTGGNNYNSKHGYHPQHHGYNNPYHAHQPTQGHSAHAIAPKNLEDTRYDDENSQFDKVNGSLVLSRYENQDIHDNSMNHSIGQFNVNDSYTQINNPSKYRNPAANYQQQHMQLSGLNNGGYNQNTNYAGNMNSNMAANMAYD